VLDYKDIVKGKQQHYKSLDGLRGLAALSVVCLHYVTAFTPFLIGYVATQRHTRLDHFVATTPLQLPLAGNFAVCIFFVLSGFVLSNKFFSTKDAGVLVSSAIRRLFRLLLPAFGSVLLAYLVLRLGFVFASQAAPLTESTTWLGAFWNFPAHLGQAVFQGLYGIWFGTFNLYASYNVVLWTMHYELFGSFLVFMFMALFGNLQNRWVFYVLFTLIFLKSYYLGFIAGMILSDIVVNYPWLIARLKPRMLWGALGGALILGAWTTTSIYTSLYARVHVPLFLPMQLEIFAHTIGAIIIVVAVLRLSELSNIFERRSLQYLGRISFSLYLTHLLVLTTVGCFLFVHLFPHFGYKLAVLGSVAFALPLTFVVAGAYTRWVDVRSIALSKQIGNYLQTADTLSDLHKVSRRLKRIWRKAHRQTAIDSLPIEQGADLE
jgi:peptidoglycan/LPS O-acetylase OafA/YrhL